MVSYELLEQRVTELERQVSRWFVLEKSYSAPNRVYEGMLVYADGTTWNPGSGAGLYQYRSSAWVFIA